MNLENLNKSILVWGALSEEATAYLKSKQKSVIVSENRPFLIGIKHNKDKLIQAKIDFVYCTDNMLGFLFYKKRIEEVVLCYKKKDDMGIVAITGTLFAVTLARLHNIKVRVFSEGDLDYSRLDKDSITLDGKTLAIDEDKEFFEPVKDEFIEKDMYEYR